MYRQINPASRQELPLRMLYQPAGGGAFYRACEADSFRGLVAALLDDPAYETADPETRLVARLRMADDVALFFQAGGQDLRIADHDGDATINIASDEPFIRSLEKLGFSSLAPGLTQ